jgi:hypothetical protein
MAQQLAQLGPLLPPQTAQNEAISLWAGVEVKNDYFRVASGVRRGQTWKWIEPDYFKGETRSIDLRRYCALKSGFARLVFVTGEPKYGPLTIGRDWNAFPWRYAAPPERDMYHSGGLREVKASRKGGSSQMRQVWTLRDGEIIDESPKKENGEIGDRKEDAEVSEEYQEASMDESFLFPDDDEIDPTLMFLSAVEPGDEQDPEVFTFDSIFNWDAYTTERARQNQAGDHQ